MDCSQRKTIFVKFGRQGGRVIEYAMLEGSSVSDLIKLSGTKDLLPYEEIYRGDISFNRGALESFKVYDKDIILIKQGFNKLTVRISKINERLSTIQVDKGCNIRQVLSIWGRMPLPNEDIWIHYDGVQRGQLGTLETPLVDGMILVLEPKKTLRDKLEDVLLKWDDSYGIDNELIDAILVMLEKDYNIK